MNLVSPLFPFTSIITVPDLPLWSRCSIDGFVCSEGDVESADGKNQGKWARSREGHNQLYFSFVSGNYMVWKKNVVVFTVGMLPVVLSQSCPISGDQVGC